MYVNLLSTFWCFCGLFWRYTSVFSLRCGVIPARSGIFRYHSCPFRFIPPSFRLVPVHSDTILVHSVSFRRHSASFRYILAYSGIFRSVPFHSVPVFSNAPLRRKQTSVNRNELDYSNGLNLRCMNGIRSSLVVASWAFPGPSLGNQCPRGGTHI